MSAKTLEDHSQLPIKGYQCSVRAVASFTYVWYIGMSMPSLHRETTEYTSVKIIKNEVRCRDGTVPKTVETRRHCEED